MSSAKLIENPEVPGLECFLPPPPPPPPPPIISSRVSSGSSEDASSAESSPEKASKPCQGGAGDGEEEEASASSSSSSMVTVGPVRGLVEGGTFSNMPVATPYILHPAAIQPQTPGERAAGAAWWMSSTEPESSELYAQWYDTTYKAAAAATVSSATVQGSAKAKNKYYKRKNEFIDPAQDAEKVASAQRELSALMKPLKCDLCNAVMNSTLQAKLHYDGKPHQKKVSMFLNQSVKKLKTEDGQLSTTSSNSNDWQNYCDICKTWFTSQTDATQHYSGKRHLRAANGGPRTRASKKPPSQNQYNQVDPSGRFGIGLAFQAEVQTGPSVPVVSEGSGASPVTGKVYTPPPYPTPLRCDLCGVSANRQDQLETHKRGARHLRMLRLNGLPVPEPVSENETTPSVPGPIDYSIYRTPSGQYYCAPCNLSLNSESMFAQHVESKKHKNQSNPKSPSSAVVVAKKARFKKK